MVSILKFITLLSTGGLAVEFACEHHIVQSRRANQTRLCKVPDSARLLTSPSFPHIALTSLRVRISNTMAEYWKSTPNYWCKFCSIYVRDTAIERKNHEASGKHLGNIQRSLRTLHKDKEKEEREKQRAKDEVARLNGLVSGTGAKKGPIEGKGILGLKDVTPTTKSKTVGGGPTMSAEQQRRVHAEQLAAMGVQLPEQLRKEVMGVGGWETVSQQVVEDDGGGLSLADIVKKERDDEEERKVDVKASRGVRKRSRGQEDDVRDEEAIPKARAVWGNTRKAYPGKGEEEGEGDLDALLSGVKRNSSVPAPKQGDADGERGLSKVESGEEKPLSMIPDIDAPPAAVKQEDEGGSGVVAPVVFKKRKVKK